METREIKVREGAYDTISPLYACDYCFSRPNAKSRLLELREMNGRDLVFCCKEHMTEYLLEHEVIHTTFKEIPKLDECETYKKHKKQIDELKSGEWVKLDNGVEVNLYVINRNVHYVVINKLTKQVFGTVDKTMMNFIMEGTI